MSESHLRRAYERLCRDCMGLFQSCLCGIGVLIWEKPILKLEFLRGVLYSHEGRPTSSEILKNLNNCNNILTCAAALRPAAPL